MKKIIIAIDGYSGCGKSTTAKLAAAEIGYAYIDTGAMYRATALYFLDHYINITNPKQVEEALKNIDIEFRHNDQTQTSDTYLNGLKVEKEIRKMRVTEAVSHVAALPEVRKVMTALQKKMGKNKGLVMDGRDIGTSVFPDAELKIFMTADVVVRAQRRQQELLQMKQVVELDKIIQNLEERDRLDTSRKESPLTQAPDAYVLDTTTLTVDSQVRFVVELYKKVISNE